MKRGQEQLPLPPAELRFMGESDEQFVAIGSGLVDELVKLCRLQTDSKVLDVGSGYGRVAYALADWGYEGEYFGVEIMRRHVEWCQSAYPNLQFSHLDVRNDRYNPGGRLLASEVTFDSTAIDVVVVTSVFTHMFPDDVRRYLSQLGKVLAPGGRILATFFCLDETWRTAEDEGRNPLLPMHHELEAGCRFHNADDPLHAIGYTPSWIRTEVAAAGLQVHVATLGRWCGRKAARGYQDTYVLEHFE